MCARVCKCAQVPASVWLVENDFANYFPFPVSPMPFLWTEAVFAQQTWIFPFTPSLSTEDKKLREWGWVGVVFYFSSKRKIAKETCNWENFISCSQQYRDVLCFFTLNLG